MMPFFYIYGCFLLFNAKLYLIFFKYTNYEEFTYTFFLLINIFLLYVMKWIRPEDLAKINLMSFFYICGDYTLFLTGIR